MYSRLPLCDGKLAYRICCDIVKRMPSEHLPKPPIRLHAVAREILDELRGQPAAAMLILGGGVALQHYCEYRETRDIDAWWSDQPSAETQTLIERIMQSVGRRHQLTLRVRNWGETQSFELQKAAQTVFSFQVAVRSIALEPALPSSWFPVQIETLFDNLGAKMNAVVNRGAPRDFLDVYSVVDRGLITVEDLWVLWSRKNQNGDVQAAKANVAKKLVELEARRPLSSLSDSKDRDSAERVRTWIRTQLCKETES